MMLNPRLLVIGILVVILVLIKMAIFIDHVYGAPLPDTRYTPGQVRNWSVERICNTTWSRVPRRIYKSHKVHVSKLYGIDYYVERHKFEYDHLIPRCLGGADTVSNLFPQSREGVWNNEKKNRLERQACILVCQGKLDLKKTQNAFATSWVSLYKEVFPLKGLFYSLMPLPHRQ